ncbi:hypothetical protein Tco_0124015, partial [Tanacetum coccineum]
IQKMESEPWNLTVKNNDLAAYTQRFQKLTMMCTKMVPEEEDRVEKFIGGICRKKCCEQKKIGGQSEGQPWTPATIQKAKCSRALHCEMWELQQGWAFDPGLSDCLKLKDQNRGNKAGNKNGVGKARGKAYVLVLTSSSAWTG